MPLISKDGKAYEFAFPLEEILKEIDTCPPDIQKHLAHMLDPMRALARWFASQEIDPLQAAYISMALSGMMVRIPTKNVPEGILARFIRVARDTFEIWVKGSRKWNDEGF